VRTLLRALGISAVVATLTGVAALVASAGVGDAIYIRASAPIGLTAGQRADLGGAITSVYGAGQFANMQSYECIQTIVGEVGNGEFKCRAGTLKTKTAAQLLDMEIAGTLPGKVNSDGTIMDAAAMVVLDVPMQTAHSTFTQSAFGITIDKLAWLRCKRANGVRCKHAAIVSATPDDWVVDKQAGSVVRTLGKVQ
jgi:hypothetical protein